MNYLNLTHKQKMDFIVRLSELKTNLCVHWPWAKSNKGYGVIKHAGSTFRVNRLVCALANGEPPEDRPYALHSCDQPSCCNHRHLVWGDQAQNMADKVSRGRAACGARNGNAVLSDFDAVLIRDMYAGGGYTYPALADMFGVHKKTVARLVRGETWRHLLPEAA